MRERVRNKLDIASIGSGGGVFEKTAPSRFPAIAAVMESALAGEFLAGGENRRIEEETGRKDRVNRSNWRKSRRIRISLSPDGCKATNIPRLDVGGIKYILLPPPQKPTYVFPTSLQ